MGQQASAISKEAIWRDHLTRYAASGKTIAAFCRDEAIAEGNFYAWRTRLRQDTANMAQKASTSAPKQVAPFIDLGPVKSRAVNHETARTSASAIAPGIDIRLDLGNGIVLTIARR
ncbi:IS66 family insertion sequence element accessory protein TnpA [Sapientia aquatica]|jgi:hypothetical protein|uniref:IS66 family insertion sequence element accessory protein TnpB n=1 Tax=Sapientia aquatica TaxID=1549640 RepID=A0A4V3ATR0_9BURK|nr:hypothetical protein [Sapientia aquatica]TDK61209.1 hypothetical protein E2I14_17635 [Sapientia aquatica]